MQKAWKVETLTTRSPSSTYIHNNLYFCKGQQMYARKDPVTKIIWPVFSLSCNGFLIHTIITKHLFYIYIWIFMHANLPGLHRWNPVHSAVNIIDFRDGKNNYAEQTMWYCRNGVKRNSSSMYKLFNPFLSSSGHHPTWCVSPLCQMSSATCQMPYGTVESPVTALLNVESDDSLGS